MRRIQVIPLAVVVSLSTSACLTEAAKCAAGHERVRGVCVSVEGDGDVGHPDSGGDDPDANQVKEDSGADGGAPGTTECYLDWDHDGAGAGNEVDCDEPYFGIPNASTPDAGHFDASSTDAAVGDGGASPFVLPAVVNRDDDCDDRDPKRAPSLKELCDGIDNNCDDTIDDNAKNACGGVCTRVLGHAPGDTCDNAQQGACARAGKYICSGDTDVVCNAPQVTASSEVCADGVDNDCDGAIDEPDALNAPMWYQDCDGDGFAATMEGAIKSCGTPPNLGACGWTQRIPVANLQTTPPRGTNLDCDDSLAAYSPAAEYSYPPAGSASYDLNCDGRDTFSPTYVPPTSNCGAGIAAWANSGADPLSTACRDAFAYNCLIWKNPSGQYTARSSTAFSCADLPSLVVIDQYSCRMTNDLFMVRKYVPGATLVSWPCR